MKRSFFVIIGIFLAGLIATIISVGWNLNKLSATIENEKVTSSAFYRLSVDAGNAVLDTLSEVDTLFTVDNSYDFNAVKEATNDKFGVITQLIAAMREDRFKRFLSQPLLPGDKNNEATKESAEQEPHKDSSTSSVRENKAETLDGLLSEIEGDMQVVQNSFEDVLVLASRKMGWEKELEPLKRELSKTLRNNFGLRDVDTRGFNDLSRGVITVLYTTSNRDVKFAGEAKFIKGYKRLSKQVLTEKQRKALEDIKSKFDPTYEIARIYVASSHDSSFFKGKAKGLSSHIKDLEKEVEHLYDQAQDGLMNQANKTTKTAITFAVIIAAISVILGLFMIRRLSARVENIVNRMKEISYGDGDLTQTVNMQGNDEFKELADAFNTFSGKIRDTILQVNLAADSLDQESITMSQASDDTYEGMQLQQQEIQSIATAMNQMAGTVQEVSMNSSNAANLSREADDNATKGQSVVSSAVDAINTLADDVSKAAEVIHSLEADADSISGILDVIKGIAEQTNLLALNAAIEAARAGEQGRGFAVVADEVRELASRTQKSTTEIQIMIEKLQSGARNAVGVMEKASNQAQSGVTHVQEAGHSLGAITEAVGEINDRNTHMAISAEEQSATTEEINRNIVNINDVAQKTFDRAEQTKKSSEFVRNGVSKVRNQLQQFKV